MKSFYPILSPPLLLLLLIGFLFIGCKGGLNSPAEPLQKVMAAGVPSENLYVAEDYDKRQPLSVAVLPFDNQTKEAEAAELLRRLFYNNFSSLSYQDIELNKVETALSAFDPAAAFESGDAAAIGAQLKADAVIMGRVTKFETLYAGVYASFTVAFELKMIGTEDNQVLWSVKHHETQRSGKVPLSPIGAIIAAATTAMDLSRYNMINTSNKLCRNSIETIPPSAALKGRSYPRITTLVHDGVNRLLKKGDKLQVGVEGSSGLTASFVISGRETPIPMQEKESGSYIGTYIVRDGDELSEGQIVVTLTDEWNNTCRWEDTLGWVNFDGVAPDPPTGINAAAGDGQAALRWNESTAEDLAGYQVLRSQTPLSGYEEVTVTEFTRFTDTDLKNDTTYFYRITARDKAGNTSPTMAGVPVTPVPPGPTLVSGELDADTVWHPGGNPYFIDQEVTLPAGSRLRIEAGVSIKAAETTRFFVKGQLVVNGQAGAPVLFSADHQGGTWEGLVFNHSDAQCDLKHLEITQAVTGITIVDASLSITSATIKNCRTGMVISGEKSAPKIKNITVYRNHDNGIVSKELAQPDITTSKIAYNGAAGLDLSQCNGKFLGNEISYNRLGVQMRQSPAILAGNRIQYNTLADFKSELIPVTALKIDLNYFGEPEKISIASSRLDADKTELAVFETADVRGPRKMVPIAKLSEPEDAGNEPTVLIKSNGAIRAPSEKQEAPAGAATPEKDTKPPENGSAAAEPPADNAIKKTPSPQNALDAFIKGTGLARKEAYPEAIALLKQAVKDTSREAEVRFWLGFCYMQTGQTKQALSNYNRAVRLDPDNLEYLLHLGTALHLNDYPDKAGIVYRKVLQRDPKNQDAKAFLKLLEETQ